MIAALADSASGPGLFIYYQVAEADVLPALAAVAGYQRQVCEAWPGLQAEAMQRPERGGGRLTWMEIYRLPASGTAVAQPLETLDALAARLADLLSQRSPWWQGDRHLERFTPLEIRSSLGLQPPVAPG